MSAWDPPIATAKGGDGTIDTASGGEYCPQLKTDTLIIDRIARQQGEG